MIQENEMGPYYKQVCEELGIAINESLLNELKLKNERKLKEMDDEITDAEQNLGNFLEYHL